MKAGARQPKVKGSRTTTPAPVCTCGCKAPVIPITGDDDWSREFRIHREPRKREKKK